MKNDTYDEREQSTSEETQAERIKMKIPETTDKPKHHEATARICVDGLSILCPNIKKNTAEIAFVKEDHTDVAINVYNSDCKKIFRHTCLQAEKARIEILKTNSNTMGKVYKKSKSDDEDFEWMPDLNGTDWYPNAVIKIKSDAKDNLSAKLVLKDADFYTREKSKNPGQQINPDGSVKGEIGSIGRVLGANITCTSGDTGLIIRIESNTGEIISQFLPKEGGPYLITVETKPIDELKDHLHHIYHLLEMNPDPSPKYGFRYKSNEDPWDNPCIASVKFTTFACQTFPGGDGPLPDFP